MKTRPPNRGKTSERFGRRIRPRGSAAWVISTWWLLAVVALSVNPATGQAPTASVEVRGTVRGAPSRTDVVVYLEPGDGAISDQSTSGLIDQRNLEFSPRVQIIASGGTVEFLNSDPILHNVFSPRRNGLGFDLGTYPRDQSRSHMFTTPGSYPVMCHVHPEMIAYVFVVPSIYYVLLDSEGRFVLGDIPPGPYTLHVWWRGDGQYEEAIVVPSEDLTLQLQIPR